MSFANLKSNRTDVSKLVSAGQELSGGGDKKKSYEDERFWKPTVDESGNGFLHRFVFYLLRKDKNFLG